jgi:DNA (cytosine-5)-methyltransferase 1
MTHGSLFSGIGGFDLAAEWMGWENVFHCEWNPFGQKILKHYWPNAISYEDITQTDFTVHRGRIDVLTGGFPCQPFSTAGKRKGKEDDRYLWPEMLRAIREIQPGWVVGENVYGIINQGGGLVFEEVCAQMENEGYEVMPFLLPACAVNAPHRRDRIWFIAYSNSIRDSRYGDKLGEPEKGRQRSSADAQNSFNTSTNSSSQRQQRQRGAKQSSHSAKASDLEKYRAFDDGGWLYESPVCSGNDGLSSRLDGITFRKWSKESIKGAGNAIVPQVAFEIFKAIEQYESL